MNPVFLNLIRTVRRVSKGVAYFAIFGLIFYGMALQFSGKELERGVMESSLNVAFVGLGIQVLIDIFFGDKLKVKA
jgi:FtsH-binding integral membrane protein